MSDDVEVDPVKTGVIKNLSHFEQPFLAGAESYDEYASYVADHHICEIMMGERNWREFGSRATRIGENIDPSVFLLLEDNLQLGVTHTWNKLNGGGGGSKIGRVIQAAYQGVQGALGEGSVGSDLMLSPLRVLSASYFESSSEWNFPLKFTFRMGQYGLWDAEKEVWNPLFALLVMSTIINAGKDTIGGWPAYETPGPTQYGLIGSLASEALTGMFRNDDGGGDEESEERGKRTISDILTELKDSGTQEAGSFIAQASKAVTLIFGINFTEIGSGEEGGKGLGYERASHTREMNYRNILYFDPCYIESVSVSFGKEKDMKGFPIEGTIDLSIKTVLSAMGNDLTGINTKWKK
ncbi:MAG: hypothetical protein LC687_04150 [Actinobacteria bacterium]|nr:hypothetical protein [Actinomycetota bacterium]MCA1807027.1 hypothetical protein [Actinomycetota bacterium]